MFCDTEVCPRAGIKSLECLGPLNNITSDDKKTFVCCGETDPWLRKVKEDEFRFCFVSETTDSCYDYSKLDMFDQIMVLSGAMAARQRKDENAKEAFDKDVVKLIHTFHIPKKYCKESFTNISGKIMEGSAAVCKRVLGLGKKEKGNLKLEGRTESGQDEKV